jgi:hypothetical protein
VTRLNEKHGNLVTIWDAPSVQPFLSPIVGGVFSEDPLGIRDQGRAKKSELFWMQSDVLTLLS